jgi:glycosyltransferase involved in cell wall biosynthesis
LSKNIWFINQYAGDSESGWGERNFYLAEEFIKKGYDVTIFSATYNHLFRNVKNFNSSSKIIFDGDVRFCWIKTVNYGKSKTLLRIYSWFEFMIKLFFISKKNMPKPDYIIVSSISVLPALNGRYFKKKYKAKKFIFEIRDLWPLTLIMLGGVSKRHPLVILLGWFEKFAYSKADDIVAVLKNADQHIKTIIKKPFTFHWIPNGIKNGLLEKANLQDMQLYLNQIPDDKFVIMYAGTLGHANAMEYVIETSNALKNKQEIHFVIIGAGDQLDVLKKMSESNHSITFIPKVSKQDLQVLLQKASAFVISWRKKSFYQFGVSANKYSDYMLTGKPIISANSIDDDPVVLANCGICIEAENTKKLTAAVLQLYNMPEKEFAALGLNGKNYVKENLMYSILSEKYIQLFN